MQKGLAVGDETGKERSAMNEQGMLKIKRMAEILVEECCDKHSLHPCDSAVNEDHQVELSLTIKELKQFLVGVGELDPGFGTPLAERMWHEIAERTAER